MGTLPVGVRAGSLHVGDCGGAGEGDTLGISGCQRDDGNVGQLTVVGTAERIKADEIKGVRVHVVSAHVGDNRGGVIRLDQGEVVGTHVGKTLGVLVNERGLGNGVGTGEVSVEGKRLKVGTSSGARKGLAGGVVGPVGLDGVVLDGEEKNLDGVGETNVKGVEVVGVEGLDGSGLHLLNEDITGSTSHSLTFVIGHDGVVGPHLAVGVEGHISGVIGGGVDGTGRGVNVEGGVGGGLVDIPSIEKFVEITERKVDTHVVVRKSGSGESHTTITSIEEGEGEIENLGGEHLLGFDKVGGLSNHVGITNLLAGGGGEGRPEIELVGIETGGDQVVESDGTLTDEIVHEIGGPREESGNMVSGRTIFQTDAGVGRRSTGGGSDHPGDGHTEPGVEKIITCTGNGNGPVLTEAGGSGGTGEDDGDLGEPGGTTSLADKVCRGIETTVHVLFEFIVGREIDETGGKIGCSVLSHYNKLVN